MPDVPSRVALSIRWLALSVGTGVVLFLFAENVREHRFLCDDTFISLRYAKNLVEGHGLVWNPGEHVEGYTNFLWVLLLAGMLRLSLPVETMAPALGVASGVLVLVGIAALGARTAGWRSPSLLAAPLLLALSRTFTAWSTGGLATQLFGALVLAALLVYFHERDREHRLPLVSSLLFALATLTRPEGMLLAGIAGAFFLVDVLRRHRSRRALALWCLPYAVVVGGHLLWRHAYYGYWLPNTYYAKVSGPQLDRALEYLALFHAEYRIGWFVPLLALPLALRPRFEHVVLLTVVVVYLSYVVSIGGGAFEFRFLVFVLPYAYWLMVEGLRRLVALGPRGPGRTMTAAVSLGVFAALVLTTHAGSQKPQEAWEAEWVSSLSKMDHYCQRRIRTGKVLKAAIDDGLLPRDVVLCVGGAGAVPYYTEWVTVDLLGLNDLHIARQPPVPDRRFGHQRRGSREYLRERGVEVFDADNRLLRRTPMAILKKRHRNLNWKSPPLGREYLSFGTFLSDEEFEARFARLLAEGASWEVPD